MSALSATDHARLARQYVFDTPPNWRRVMADYLVNHGHRFARGDFWDAYSVTFLANERTIVASTSVVFIREYQWLVADHAGDAVSIEHEPCPGGTLVTGRVYVCPPR